MNAALCIAKREYLATVRTKGFIIGLLLMPLLMFGAVFVMVLVKDHKDTRDRPIAILDLTGRMAPVLVAAAERRNSAEVHAQGSGKKVAPAYLLEVVPPWTNDLPAQRLALSDRVRAKELHAFLEIGPNLLRPKRDDPGSRVTYHSPGAALDEVRSWLANPINQELRRWRLAEAGITEQQVPHLFEWTPVESMSLVSADVETGEVKEAEHRGEAEAVIVPFVLVIVMYMMVLMAGLPMLNAVMEEKSQRIAEVLLGSARPFSLMLGKLLSAVAVALTGAVVYLSLGVMSGAVMAVLAFVPWHILPWFAAFLVPAILMYTALAMGLGSACNDPKDAQNLTFPLLLPAMLPMFFLAPVLREPQSTFAIALSLFPPFTPMLMLLRLGVPNGASVWQGLIGLAGVIGAAWLSIWISSRIFRVALLVQGHSPRLKDFLRWAVKG